jgi:hypothetical protein
MLFFFHCPGQRPAIESGKVTWPLLIRTFNLKQVTRSAGNSYIVYFRCISNLFEVLELNLMELN